MYESLVPLTGFRNTNEHEALNTSLKYLSEENVRAIKINNGILRIENSQEGETILIINSNGCIINSLKGNNETIDINVSDKGLLLVKAGDKILKIIN